MENQNKTDLESNLKNLEDKINQLRQEIEDSYYRIPKEDFETVTREKLAQEVTDKLDKKITSWRNWAAILIGVLSFFGFTQISSIYKNLEEKNDKLMKELNQQIDNRINSKWNETEQALKGFSKFQDDRINAKDSFQSLILQTKLIKMDQAIVDVSSEQSKKQVAGIKDDIQNIKKESLRSELLSLKSDYDAKRITTDETLGEMEKIVMKAINLGENTTAAFALEEMIYIAFVAKKDAKVVELYNKYKNEKLEFTVTGLKNICLSNLCLYVDIYSPIYRQNIIETYNETLKLQPDHSHAHAMRITLHVIDYMRATDETERETEKKEIFKYINGILSSSNDNYKTGIIDYFHILSTLNSSMSNYIHELYILLPSEMKEFEKFARDKETNNAFDTLHQSKN
jgi:hypothetical protein